MAVDLLQLGVSGLYTSQQQLSTTGHNIANVNTDGYSRQRVLQETQTPITSGQDFLGTGSKVLQIERVYDEFRYNELVFNQTLNSGASTTVNKLQRLDETMSLTGTGITDSLNELFAAVNSLIDIPGDIGLREVMLSKANTLSQNMESMQRSLNAEYTAVNEELDASAKMISKISEQLAALNRDIVKASANDATPSDLLDQRDGLIKELSTYTTVSTVETNDNALNVYIGSGQTLVTGTTYFSVHAVTGDPEPEALQMAIESSNGIQQTLLPSSLGGSLGALVEYRDGILSETMNKVGQTAITVADAFNQVQSQGFDLNEMAGQNLFKDINDSQVMTQRFIAKSTNAGTTSGEIQITDTNLLTSDDYSMTYLSGNYVLTNDSTGETQTLVADDPLALVGSRTYTTSDGFMFRELGGAPAEGDDYVIQPTRLGATHLDVELTSPEQIATSSIVEVYASDDNINSATLTVTSVDNIGDSAFPTSGNGVTVEVYESPVGTYNYQVLDSSGTAQPLFDSAGTALGTSATYTTSPLSFSSAGLSFSLTGNASGQTSNAPEVYHVDYAFGEGNNSNVIAMADINDTKLANAGRATISDIYEESVTNVGSAMAAARVESGATQTLYDQAQARVSSTSGVNLDEEAANLLRYQQAYSASAKVITVANEIFQTILQAAR